MIWTYWPWITGFSFAAHVPLGAFAIYANIAVAVFSIHNAIFILADFDELTLFTNDFTLTILETCGGGFGRTLCVVNGKVGQFHLDTELVLLGMARCGLNEADVEKYHLTFFDCAFVEYLGRNLLRH